MSTLATWPDPELLTADRSKSIDALRRRRRLPSSQAVAEASAGWWPVPVRSRCVGRSARPLVELADTALVEAAGGTEAFTVDVTDATAVASRTFERLGPIDLLINNAGIVGPIGPLWEVDADAWWATFDVNLRGTLLCSRVVLPAMVARQRGRIINITSQAGAHRWPLVSAYSVSKAAVIKFTENLAHETARHGVSVFSVHPGLLPIGMSETVLAHAPTTPRMPAVAGASPGTTAAAVGVRMPQQATELILRLAAGHADHLAGRHLRCTTTSTPSWARPGSARPRPVRDAP
jgi:NAD(P)-dependent dehydrogenase (short-subunit alcohol dehydrogenase family)